MRGGSDEGAVGEPGEGDGAEAEGKGNDEGEETDAGVGVLPKKGDEVGDEARGFNEGNADGHHDEADEADDPCEDCIHLLLEANMLAD